MPLNAILAVKLYTSRNALWYKALKEFESSF